MRSLERHDVRIDCHAERDSDAAEAHDGRRDAERPHRPEGEQQHDRKRDERHQRAARVQEENQDDQDDDADLLGQRAQERVPRALGEVDAVVGGGDADLGCGARVHPARIGRAVGQLSALASDGLLHRFDQLFEIGVAARDDDPAYRLDPREVCHARRHVLGEADARDVADPRGALSRDPDRCRFEIGQRHFRGRIVAPLGDGPQRGYHIGEGEGTLAQLARFHLDADLPDVAADRGDLGDAGDRRERRAKHLVLEAAQVELRRHELRIAQGVFEHPTGAGSGRADLEPHVRGQPGAQFVDPIDDRAVRIVEARSRIEDDVDVGHSRHRRAANRLCAGDVLQRLRQDRRHPGGDFGRCVPHPVGHHADLRIRQVGNDVAGEAAARDLAARGEDEGGSDHEPMAPCAPRYQARDHGDDQSSSAALAPRRRSASRKNVARETTGSWTPRPESTTTKPCFEKVSPISIRRLAKE